jgi:hypothetical protein
VLHIFEKILGGFELKISTKHREGNNRRDEVRDGPKSVKAVF